jgi:hypothetical protein
LRAAVLKLFTAKFPELVEPPWKSLFAKYNDVWGPEGMDAVAVTWGMLGKTSFIYLWRLVGPLERIMSR